MAELIGRTRGKERGGTGEGKRAGTVGPREASAHGQLMLVTWASWALVRARGKIAQGHLEGRGKREEEEDRKAERFLEEQQMVLWFHLRPSRVLFKHREPVSHCPLGAKPCLCL